MNFYIPVHIRRLVFVFVIFISIFLFVRHLLIPASFGLHGHYRANSLADNSQIPIHYSGESACFECHQDVKDVKALDVHKDIHCETCHGPGQKHVQSSNAEDIIKPSGREFCGRCHGLNAAKQNDVITQVDLKKHNTEKNCLECHNPHEPWKVKK